MIKYLRNIRKKLRVSIAKLVENERRMMAKFYEDYATVDDEIPEEVLEITG